MKQKVCILEDVTIVEFSRKVQVQQETQSKAKPDAMDTIGSDLHAQTHPLSVNVSFDIEEGTLAFLIHSFKDNKKHKITLKFYHLVHFNIVTVSLSAPTITAEDATPIVVNLYPNDTGILSPNPATSRLARFS